MSYKFKVGDEVVLAVDGKCGEEGREWWREEGMQVGNIYKIRALDQDHISVVNGKFWHHPDHFVLASEYVKGVEGIEAAPLASAPPQTVIEIGDWVKVKSWKEQTLQEGFDVDGDDLPLGWTDTMVSLCGAFGEVVETNEDDFLPFGVKFHSGTHEGRQRWFSANQITLMTEPAAPETPLEAPETSGDEATQLEQPTEAPSPVSEAIKSDGGSSSYYTFIITNAKGESMEVETGDVIRAMVGNDFDFGNCVKALRRMYLAKNGKGGKMGVDVAYDANKIRWFVDQIEKR